MFLVPLVVKLRQQRVWRDPYRKYRTLLSFSETEEDGGKDLLRAAKRVTDADLRLHIERHANDEVRHALLFRTRAAEVAAEHEIPIGAANEPDRPYDLSGARAGFDLDAHGFFNAGLIDELGELEYVAMLHVAEKKAAQLFALYKDMNSADARTSAVFEEILRDEKYHVAYTNTFLEKWRKQGRGREIDDALSAATGNRLLGAWKRLGMRSASGFSHAVLFILYWTVLAPFGLIARARALPKGLQAARTTPPELRAGQY